MLGSIVATLFVWHIVRSRQPSAWQHVLATREGDIGHLTSTQMRIRPESRFVALPDPSALGRLVEVRYRERTVVVLVLDVGPWNIDDPYWDRDDRPASERGKGAHRKPSNRAGIDLSDPVFAELGMRDNDEVDWRFVREGYMPLPTL